MFPALRGALVAGVLLLGVSGCVIFDFPDDPQVTSPPAPGEQTSTVTIVRKKQFAGSGITQSIMLDGAFIVNLKANQYTSFKVSAGQHMLGTAWRIGGVAIIGPGGALGQGISDFLTRELELDCIAGQHYYLVIEAMGIALHEVDRIRFEQVERLEGDFALDGKDFVPVGSRDEKSK